MECDWGRYQILTTARHTNAYLYTGAIINILKRKLGNPRGIETF